MYRIGINALGFKNESGGPQSSIYNTVKYLLKNDNENKYFLFVAKNNEYVFEDLKHFPNLKVIVYPIDSNNSTIRVITEHTFLVLGILKHRIQLMHHNFNYMPRFCPTKSITTLHDLSGFFFYENLPHTKVMTRYYNYLKNNMAYTFKHAKKVIVISEFTRSEVHKYYDGISDDLMITIPQSLDSRKNTAAIREQIFEDFNINKPYILSVSVVRPHKNFPFLIKIFNKIKERYKIPHQLVISGKMGVEMQGLEKNDFLEEIESSPYKKDIKYVGFTSSEDLASLYTNADLYVTTTLYEGFGSPLIEAMRYKLPIACSNAASLPEVGGNGCIYFDPYNEDDACEKVYKLISDKNLRKNILIKQKERLEYYSWDRIAKQIIKLYSEVINE